MDPVWVIGIAIAGAIVFALGVIVGALGMSEIDDKALEEALKIGSTGWRFDRVEGPRQAWRRARGSLNKDRIKGAILFVAGVAVLSGVLIWWFVEPRGEHIPNEIDWRGLAVLSFLILGGGMGATGLSRMVYPKQAGEPVQNGSGS